MRSLRSPLGMFGDGIITLEDWADKTMGYYSNYGTEDMENVRDAGEAYDENTILSFNRQL